MNKKFQKIIALCTMATAAIMMTPAVAAQTSDFYPRFFILPQAGVGLTIGESNIGALCSPAAALSLGYQFTPSFSIRAGVSGWQARGAWAQPRHNYKFGYLQANADAVLSFTDVFCGHASSRVLDFYGFVGLGLAGGFHNNEVIDLNAQGYEFEKIWVKKTLFPAGRAGLGLDINLSKSVALNLEVNAGMLPDRFNSKKGSAVDWQYNALAGVKLCFGGNSRKTDMPVEPQTQLVVREREPAPQAQQMPQEPTSSQPAPVVNNVVPMTQDIYFRINSSVILQSERPKVETLIQYLVENADTKVVITGYADKETGYPAYNMKLSAARATSVAEALKAAGIHESRIIVEAKGDTVQPYDSIAKNRVAIAIAQ